MELPAIVVSSASAMAWICATSRNPLSQIVDEHQDLVGRGIGNIDAFAQQISDSSADGARRGRRRTEMLTAIYSHGVVHASWKFGRPRAHSTRPRAPTTGNDRTSIAIRGPH